MYEENLTPLPPGDATAIFAAELQVLARQGPPSAPLSPDNVVQFAEKSIQPPLAAICRKLLLPGSSIKGWQHLEELSRLSGRGNACLLCLSHVSNLDVPNLYTIIEDQHDLDVFHQIIWIAGRKLSEDTPLTRILIQSCNRIVITPPSWFSRAHSAEEEQAARRINRAAQRELLRLRKEGWIFGLFPTGTRRRADDESTSHAIPETDTYVKSFDYMVLGRIDGCTLPVSKDRDFTHEIPRRDRLTYTLSPVQRTSEWRANALAQFTELGQRRATARAIDEYLSSLPRP